MTFSIPSRPSPPHHHVVSSPSYSGSAGSHSHHLMEEPSAIRPHYSTNSTVRSTESVLHQQWRNLCRHQSQAMSSAAMTRRDLHSAPTQPGQLIACDCYSTAVMFYVHCYFHLLLQFQESTPPHTYHPHTCHLHTCHW